MYNGEAGPIAYCVLITITCECRGIFSSISCDPLKVSKVGWGLTVIISL